MVAGPVGQHGIPVVLLVVMAINFDNVSVPILLLEMEVEGATDGTNSNGDVRHSLALNVSTKLLLRF